jgi:hypothetical protein
VKGVNLEASKLFSVGGEGIVCFDNPKAPYDKLCIFQNFATGNVNVEQMDPGNALETNLSKLIGGSQQNSGSLNGMRMCLHHGNQASVGWTHLHTFPASGPQPDGLVDGQTAYCVDFSGDVAAAAKSLAAKVRTGR